MNDFKCLFCGHTHAAAKTTQYIYRHNGEFLVVNKVPCEECEFCGEQYFDAAVLKQIEQDFQDIHSGRRKADHLSVPVEQFA